MENNIEAYDDEMEDSDEMDAEEVPADPKQVFSDTVAKISYALNQHDVIYPQLIAAVAPFDKKLAALIEASAAADRQMFEYLRGKAEVPGPKTFIDRIVGILTGR